jgi:hypothetical protein
MDELERWRQVVGLETNRFWPDDCISSNASQAAGNRGAHGQ